MNLRGDFTVNHSRDLKNHRPATRGCSVCCTWGGCGEQVRHQVIGARQTEDALARHGEEKREQQRADVNQRRGQSLRLHHALPLTLRPDQETARRHPVRTIHKNAPATEHKRHHCPMPSWAKRDGSTETRGIFTSRCWLACRAARRRRGCQARARGSLQGSGILSVQMKQGRTSRTTWVTSHRCSLE